MKEISIIIPHYNSYKKLERLLKSIPLDNLKVEVIVVDDNSKDEEIYKNLQLEFKNVIFLKNKSSNKGAGGARNEGLKIASGKWLLFADADDYFESGAFKKVFSNIDKKEDIIYFKPTSVYEKTKKNLIDISILKN